MTNNDKTGTDTFGPLTPQPEQVPASDSEYLRDLLDCAEPDKWEMVAQPTGELIIRGIQPIDGQLMLLSDAITRDLIAIRAQLAQRDVALAEAKAREGRLLQARDEAHEAADRLAYACFSVEEIGEHTNLNCPWTNAAELLEAREKGGE